MPHAVLTSPESAAICAQQPAASAATVQGASVTCYSELDQIEAVWRGMVQNGAHCSGYQHFDWVHCWLNSSRTQHQLEPSVLVCTMPGREPVLLLPLVTRKLGPLRIAMFMGGSHANFNLPIWTDHPAVKARDFADQVVRKLDADVLLLVNQPRYWDGIPNPLAGLRQTPGANQGHGGSLDADFGSLMSKRMGRSSRRKLRQKTHRLEELGAIRYWQAEGPDQIRTVLDAFFAQKDARMRELGLPNVFADPDTRDFIEAATRRIDPATGKPVIELYAMSVGDDIVATFGGIVDRDRFSGMFNSMTDGAYREYSPGEHLLVSLVEQCCKRGLNDFDLGIGDATYKKTFCYETIPLMDCVMPLSPRGQLAALAIRAGLMLKRTIKQSDQAMLIYRRLTSLLSPKGSA